MNIKRIIASVAGCVALGGWLSAGGAGVPIAMNYQGILNDAHGVALSNQNLTVNFRFYNAEKGGTMLWGTRKLVTTDGLGLFNATLDDMGEDVPDTVNVVANLQEVFSGSDADKRWIEVDVEYGRATAMSPRQRFYTQAYAFQTGDALNSATNFNVGGVLTVQSNAYLQSAVSLLDTEPGSLTFHNTVTNQDSLTVSQQLHAVSALTVNNSLTVAGAADFTNNVTFASGVDFLGPVYFKNGLSLRGNTSLFGSMSRIAFIDYNHGGRTTNGTVTVNGLMGVHFRTQTRSGDNTVTFTLNGKTYNLKADWNTGETDSIKYEHWQLFVAKANSSYSINVGGDDISCSIYFRPIPFQ